MKNISLLLLMVISIFAFYQFQKPILTEDNAILGAIKYVNIVNEKMNANFNTDKIAEYCVLERGTFWNKITGTRQWSVMIDGVAVDIKANTGEFVQMVFPLGGVITELPK
ncbi:hypothetical protein D3C78_1053240 [compost metagenome]